MARAMWLRDVLEDLRRQGVPVRYVSGFESRGSTTFDPRGIICHDTGGSANSSDAGEINVLLNGSTSAPAPIAQFYLSRTTGVHLVATGRCNHALTGTGGPLKGYGNTNLIGIEAAANPGRPWPPAQYRWYVQLVATLCRHRGWDATHNVAAHREHQPGQKVDPQGIDMGRFRADVTAAIRSAHTTESAPVTPTRKKARMLTVYFKKATSTAPACWALAGGNPAWVECDQQVVANGWASLHGAGGSIEVTATVWDTLKKQYTSAAA